MSSTYQAQLLLPSENRVGVVRRMLEETAASDNLFMEGHFATTEERQSHVASMLGRPDTLVWEVWKFGEEPELTGVIYFTRIVPGADAIGHYIFFDETLGADKTRLMRDVMDWVFQEHEDLGWEALNRLTVEVPDYAFILARHASEKLGFGGPFEYHPKGRDPIAVEGVKRDAVFWDGGWHDKMILGLQREDFHSDKD